MLRSILVSFFLSFIFLCSGSLLSAQQRSTFYDVEEVNAGAYLGIGVGLDYGGIGVKAEYMATPAFSGFAGVGYNFVGALVKISNPLTEHNTKANNRHQRLQHQAK